MKISFQRILVLGFFLVLVFLLVGKQTDKSAKEINKEESSTQYIKISGTMIKTELALTPAEKEQGLSGRSMSAEDESMLFVFDQPGKYAFWMKDMNFAIDIIWLGEDLRIVYIKKDARPESYPEIFSPEQDSKYVLEVVSGFSDKNNLKVGDKMEFTF